MPERDFWAARIGEVVANDGDEENFPKMCLILQDIEGPLVHTLLRNLAHRQTGKAYTARGLLKTEPTLSPSAYLCLALRADTSILPELEAALTTSNTPADRAALEMAVAAVDGAVSVRSEHLTQPSWFLGLTGLKVVAKAPTRENMDALVYGGFHNPTAIVSDKAFSLFQEITGHSWPLPSRYKGDIQRWWEQHRTEFASTVEPNRKK